MFEVGKDYEFVTQEDDIGTSRDEVKFRATVTKYQHPLLELDDGTILNVASDRFVRAKPTGST